MNNTRIFNIFESPIAGLNLIEANAGSGKTFTIAIIFLRLILEQNLSVSQILVVTFTEAATNELKKRIRDLLVDAHLILEGLKIYDDSPLAKLLKSKSLSSQDKLKLKKAILELDEAQIYTIHGFSKKILNDYAFETNHLFDAVLESSSDQLIQDSFYTFLRQYFLAVTPEISHFYQASLLNEINLASFFCDLKSLLSKPNLEFSKDQAKATFYQFSLFQFKNVLEKVKKEKNQLTFDDLIFNLFEAVKSDYKSDLVRILNQRFKTVLIDEFQDTDIMQYEIFQELFLNNNAVTCFLIGDPKQSIYAFRGADLFSYHKVKATVPETYFLTSNFRSEFGLINAINTLFRQDRVFLYDWLKYQNSEYPLNKKNEELQLKITGANGQNLEIIYFDSDLVAKAHKSKEKIRLPFIKDIIAKDLACKIINLLAKGFFIDKANHESTVKLKDIAILLRKNSEILFLKNQLTKMGLKTICYFDENIFDSSEYQDLLALLKAINAPTNINAVKRVLLTSFFNVTLNDLSSFGENFSHFEIWINKFAEYKSIWQRLGFAAMIKIFQQKESIKNRLVLLENGEKFLANYLQLIEILEDADYKNKFAIAELITWFQKQGLKSELKSGQTILRIDSDVDAIKLMTIHKCKGLEFPIVFCPFVWGEDNKKNAFFHDPSNAFKLTIDLENANENLEIVKESLAENLRLLYVALSRARNAAYLYWGNLNISPVSSQNYLFHVCSSLKSTSDLENWLCDPKKDQKSSSAMLVDLMALSLKAQDSIKITNYFEIPEDYCKSDTDKIQEQYEPEFHFKSSKLNSQLTEKRFSVLSYTALTHFDQSKKNHNLLDESLKQAKYIAPTLLKSILDLPPGKKTGIFLHEILSKLNFQSLDQPETSKIVIGALQKYGFDLTWVDFLTRDISSIFNISLGFDDPDFKLNRIENNQRLSEVKFYYPLKQISRQLIFDLFSDFSNCSYKIKDFMTALKLPNFFCSGFMEGVIDLIFTYNNKFYLIDWKTNYLGPSFEDYQQKNLFKSILSENYFLQYYFYAIAFDQYLRTKLPNYRFQDHFGGIYYLFLRGMKEGTTNGIYFDQIPEKLLLRFRNEFFV